MRVRVPAKINLHLGVGESRADGYHELLTVFQAVDLHDEVTATAAADLSLAIEGAETGGVPDDSDNLAWRAAELLGDEYGVPPRAALRIRKSIPVAGGMAGGSADAAATLLACSVLWGLDLPRPELALLAAELGSDVAFALTGGTALGTGRGEQLTPALATGQFHWVLALADFGLSTADAYRELDRQRAAGTADDPLGPPDALLDALRAGDAVRVAAELGNDLQPAALALAPQLRATLRAGTELGALAAIVSGSGPTCAFLVADGGAATALAAALAGEGVCRTTRVTAGPVPGARVSS